MSTEVMEVLEKLKQFSFDELQTVQKGLTQEIEAKQVSPTPNKQKVDFYSLTPDEQLDYIAARIPGAYRPTKEQIEAELASIFTPEQIAEIGKRDFTKWTLPGKSMSEMIIEDREDRF